MFTFRAVVVSLLVQVFILNTVSGLSPFRNNIPSARRLQLSSSNADEPALRIGHGFDIHRLIEGTKLIIGAN